MKNKLINILIVVGLIFLSFVSYHIILSLYDIYKDDNLALSLKIINEEEACFLDQVKKTWKNEGEAKGPSVMSLSALKLESKTANIIEFLTRTGIWRDSDKMARLWRFLIKRGSPISEDNTIYSRKDRKEFYMKLDWCIIVYSDEFQNSNFSTYRIYTNPEIHK